MLPIGKAKIERAGKDVTITAFSIMVGKALHAAEELAKQGIDAEVINLRSLRPLDTETIVNSVKKTNRLVTVEEGWPFAGIGSELAAQMMEQAFDWLDAPVKRVHGHRRAAALCRQSREAGAAAAGEHRRGRPRGLQSLTRSRAMSINILMPALSPTMTEGKLAKWHVKEGDAVKSGQVICEIETDKATMEVEAVDEGRIGKIVVPEGAEGVKVNAVDRDPAGGGRDLRAGRRRPCTGDRAESRSNAGSGSVQAGPGRSCPCSSGCCSPGTCRTSARGEAGGGAERRAHLRLAARQAHRRGEGARSLAHQGQRARTAASSRPTSSPPSRAPPRPPLRIAAGAPRAAPPPAGQPVFAAPGDTRVPHTSMRKVIARRMLESKQTVPHFYLTVDLEIDALLAARQAINAVAEKKGTKVSVNDMVIKACAKALRDHPECNASWTEDEMIQYGTVDISVAVATDRGLITPIVRNADMKGLAQIAIGDEGPRRPRQGRQAEARGVPGRQLHHLQSRHVRHQQISPPSSIRRRP